MADIISKIIPILLLIALGRYFCFKNILRQSTVDEMKKIVIDVALSAVLFITFLNMELKKEYFLICIVTFVLLIVFYFIGLVLNRIKAINHPLMPFITSGFAFGFLGIPLFTTIFGGENIGKLSILGVGHEFFIWFVFYPIIQLKLGNQRLSMKIVKETIKSPIIISIVLGIVFNLVGLKTMIDRNSIMRGLYGTVESLSILSTPLILIIIGYGLKLNKKYMKQSVIFLVMRTIIILSVGYIIKFLIIDTILAPDQIFNYAYFTFLILPPPLSLPIFVGAYSTKEHEELIINTVVLGTVISIVAFILFVLFI